MVMEEYFNFYDLFVNRIAGSEILFIFFSFILIALMCAIVRMPNIITLFIFITYALIIATVIPVLLVIVLLIAGILIAFGLSRIISPQA